MAEKRVSLYERLPEIYRIRDDEPVEGTEGPTVEEIYRMRDNEQIPPGQLKHYLALVEEVFADIHKNIEALYHDLFIETCDDWVVPYIGDLLGTSHLKGDPWSIRADVADTIALRRRKGTLAGIERLTYNLTKWGVHCAELRENLVWNQHLNHQRPDIGGQPPYSLPTTDRFTPIRGGTVTLRDPATLSLLKTPFDPFAHVADVKPPIRGGIRYNLPNLAIFLWRLEDNTIQVSRPFFDEELSVIGESIYLVRFTIDPLGRPLRLFNTYQFNPDLDPPIATQLDETPSPIPTARLSEECKAGNPEKYFSIDTYNPSDFDADALDISDVGLQFHLPSDTFEGQNWPSGDEEHRSWIIRGANLCAWENGLPDTDAVAPGDIVIDPVIGRGLIAVDSSDKADALRDHLLITYTYGAVGPVGAYPVFRKNPPPPWDNDVDERQVSHFIDEPLSNALSNLNEATSPVIIEINDSMVYDLDWNTVIRLNQPLLIRAADGQRPIIRLAHPLRFCPVDVADAEDLTVRFEGVFLTRSDEYLDSDPCPLISCAALGKLEFIGCTLDPGGFKALDGNRTPIYPSLTLDNSYGFTEPDEALAFDQTPEIVIEKSITGPLLIDSGYTLSLKDSIIDAGKSVLGTNDAPNTEPSVGDAALFVPHFAVSAASNVSDGWGPTTHVEGITVFGRMRVESIDVSRGIWKGGIWVDTLEIQNNQKGCIKFSYFSGNDDRLPSHPTCVTGNEVPLHFVSEIFGEPAYGQLAHSSDFRIRERGPDDDVMGAFGFLKEAHKWRNLQIRYREFMPVDIRPLMIPVT